MNTCVSRIVRRQAVIGGFTVASSPSSKAFEDESDNGSSSEDVDDAGSPSDNEMFT